MNRWITFSSSAAAPESHRLVFRFGLNTLLVIIAFLALSNSLYAQGKGGKKGGGGGGGGGGGDTLPDPTVVVALDEAASEITLGWISGGGSTAGFIVAYEKDGMPRKKCSSGTQIDVGDVEEFTITGLNYDSLYGIRVCAYDDAGERSNGITIQVVTRKLMDRQALDNWTNLFFPATNSDGANGAGVAIQPDGKILVAGYVRREINKAITMCVVRYNPDLSIDTSFGNGGLAICVYDNRVWSVGTEILLLDDGSMLVAGFAEGNDRGVVRFSSSGEVLSQFIDDYDSSPPIRGMIVQGDKVYLMRQADRDGPDEEGFTNFTTDFGLYRLHLDDLTLDTSFGEEGEAWYDIGGLKNQGASITEMADGSIFAQGSVTLDNELPKFLHYVIFDTTGHVMFEQTLPIYADPGNGTVLTDSNGNIYMTGTSPLDASNTTFGGFIVKVNPDGSLDTSFGEAGVITTMHPLSKATFDSQDRLVALAGRTSHWEGQARDVIRFKQDFSRDGSFGDNGIVALKPPGEAAPDAPVWGISDLALDAEDRPVLVGKAGAYYTLTGPAWIIRLNK